VAVERPVEATPPIIGLLEDGVWAAPGDAPSIDSPTYRQFLEALGVAVYTTDADGRITFFNEAAATFWGRRPEMGERWCGSWRMFWPDGRPMPHDECPMAIAVRTGQSVRGHEGLAERPDGTRASFVPYPTVVRGPGGEVIGAINVVIDVTERRQAEEALRAANAVKDEFLGLVSHELRTPVTTVFGNASLLRDRPDLPASLVGMVSDVADGAERLLGVVENLLLLSRPDALTEMDPEPQMLKHVVGSIVESFHRHHPGRVIEMQAESRQIIVEADRALLELLIGNLLSNAHKYSPDAASIEVAVSADEEEARVTVRDRGIGFAPEEADQLFENFHRTEAAKKVGSGLGIGLSACRRIAGLLGGRIWARPREGGGAEFVFALPLVASDHG